MAKEKNYPFPSRFGSHSIMINVEKTASEQSPAFCWLDDEFGTYRTERSRLDDGLADPNRISRYDQNKVFRDKED